MNGQKFTWVILKRVKMRLKSYNYQIIVEVKH